MVTQNSTKRYNPMYNLTKTELMSQFFNQLSIWAVECWKHSGVTDNEISTKLDKLVEDMEYMDKTQWIAVYNNYKNQVYDIRSGK